MGDRLGQNVRNDRGIIPRFHKECDFDMCFTSQSPDFPTNLNFIFSVQTCDSLLGDIYVGPLFS